MDRLILIVALITIVYLYLKTKRRPAALPYPPGPKKLPLLGNLLNIPTTFEWEKYAQWGKDYSTPYSFSLFLFLS